MLDFKLVWWWATVSEVNMTSVALLAIVALWCGAVCQARPLEELIKSGNPCSAALLHVQGLHSMAGNWTVRLGQLEAAVSHIVEGSLNDSKEPGEWVAALYNRDQGCTEDDLRQFIGTLDGVVPEEGNGEHPSRERPVLPDGYTTIDQVGSYKWHLEQKGWDEAEATCQSEGGHLVVIDSDKEALFVLDLFHSQKGEDQTDLKSSHYGVRDNEQDGSFVTIYGTPLSETGYERWARGQPDDENGVEFCIELLRNGEFNDESCFKELPFICEILFHYEP